MPSLIAAALAAPLRRLLLLWLAVSVPVGWACTGRHRARGAALAPALAASPANACGIIKKHIGLDNTTSSDRYGGGSGAALGPDLAASPANACGI